MAASFNKFQDFVEQLCLAKHQLNTDTLKVALTNVAPVATNTVLADLTQIASGNGYTTGGEDSQNTLAESPAGTATMTCTAITWTGGASAMAQFRYVVIYNDTQTSPADALVGWWDYTSGVTLNPGETFTWKPNGSATTGTVLTVS